MSARGNHEVWNKREMYEFVVYVHRTTTIPTRNPWEDEYICVGYWRNPIDWLLHKNYIDLKHK